MCTIYIVFNIICTVHGIKWKHRDISNNLKPAYEIKIKTVLIKKIIDRRYNKDYINYIISDLTEALTKLTNKEIFNGNK